MAASPWDRRVPFERRLGLINDTLASTLDAERLSSQESDRLSKASAFDLRKYRRATERTAALRKLAVLIERFRDQEVREAVAKGEIDPEALRKAGVDPDRFGLESAAADIARLRLAGARRAER